METSLLLRQKGWLRHSGGTFSRELPPRTLSQKTPSEKTPSEKTGPEKIKSDAPVAHAESAAEPAPPLPSDQPPVGTDSSTAKIEDQDQ